jgi:hypothetical protein
VALSPVSATPQALRTLSAHLAIGPCRFFADEPDRYIDQSATIVGW